MCLISKSLSYQVRNDIDVWIKGKSESFQLELDLGRRKLMLCIGHRVLGGI